MDMSDKQAARRREARHGAHVYLLVLLSASLGLNVFLALRLRSTPAYGEGGRGLALLKEGASVSPFVGTDVHGLKRHVAFSDVDKPTVIYVFSLECIWCERNLANVRGLASSAASSHRFIGLSLRNHELSRLAAEARNLGFPVLSEVSPEVVRSMGLGGTPQTIVVSPDGRIIKNWEGAYGSSLQREVEEYFGTSLPGLDGIDGGQCR